MPASVLAIKLAIPNPPKRAVTRPRLLARLHEVFGCKAALVVAPAGWGKTALLSEWCLALDRRAVVPAWLSLDDGDNDPARFWRSLTVALDRAVPDRFEYLRAITDRSASPIAEAVVTALVDSATLISTDVVLVLDDYHVVTEPSIHKGVRLLLSYLPPRLHIVCAGRTDPPLSPARLRALGQIVDVRAKDLAWSTAEAHAYLTRTLGLSLEPHVTEALAQRAEGWIVGLRLMGNAIQRRGDHEHALEVVGRSERAIRNYLVEEVLASLSATLRSFLLRTCIASRLTGSLCDELTGTGGGQATLEELEEAGFFVTSLGADRQWYRYHHFLAGALRGQLHRSDPALERALHRAASDFYARHDLPDMAIEHAFDARDTDRAAELIERHAERQIHHGELATIVRWLEAVPKGVVTRRPRLSLTYAWALAHMGRLDVATAWLDAAERHMAGGATEPFADALSSSSDDEARSLLADTYALRARIAAMRLDDPGAIRWSHASLNLTAPARLTTRSEAALTLGFAEDRQGDAAAAMTAFEEAMRSGRRAGNLRSTLLAARYMAGIATAMGDLRRAHAIALDALRFADSRAAPSPPAVGFAHLSLAESLYEWNDLDDSERHAVEALRLGKLGGDMKIIAGCYTVLARLLAARGEIDGALDVVQELHQYPGRPRSPGLMASLHLRNGDVVAARMWARPLDVDDEYGLRRLDDHLVVARLWIAEGRHADAIQMLDGLAGQVERAGQRGRTARILTILSVAHSATGNHHRAMAALSGALEIAATAGYVRLFLDEGPPLRSLVRRWLRESPVESTAMRLTACARGFLDMKDWAPGTSPDKGHTVLPNHATRDHDQLTRSERDVLRLLAGGRSTQEVARELVVTPNTIKSHIAHIYQKLGVHNRAQAAVWFRDRQG